MQAGERQGLAAARVRARGARRQAAGAGYQRLHGPQRVLYGVLREAGRDRVLYMLEIGMAVVGWGSARD